MNASPRGWAVSFLRNRASALIHARCRAIPYAPFVVATSTHPSAVDGTSPFDVVATIVGCPEERMQLNRNPCHPGRSARRSLEHSRRNSNACELLLRLASGAP
jgi:hypothetical protein